ncbi:hypothetical protein D3C73_743310 [compost metagenome]
MVKGSRLFTAVVDKNKVHFSEENAMTVLRVEVMISQHGLLRGTCRTIAETK